MAGFRKAKAEQAAAKIAFYGPPGSGKTLTSLLVAEGLAAHDGKRVAFVDTERGTDFYCKDVPERAVHPAAFDFDALYTRSLTETLAAVKSLKPAEYSVVVIDSITHLWESARAAYSGNETRVGSIPFHAWGKIKKPYKELVAFLLSSPLHVIICGRQGNEFAEDEETGETKRVGVKMKAEGETAYEPHILIRMEMVKGKNGEGHVVAFAEKDRTGILAGKTFTDPDYKMIGAPVLKLLGGTQARIETEEETGMRDADALAEQERQREASSARHLKTFKARIDLAASRAELEKIGKEITPELKKQMLADDVAALREAYKTAEQLLAQSSPPPAADGSPAPGQAAAPTPETRPGEATETESPPSPAPSRAAAGASLPRERTVDTSESQVGESWEDFEARLWQAVEPVNADRDAFNAAIFKSIKAVKKKAGAELTQFDRTIIIGNISGQRGPFAYLKDAAPAPVLSI